MVVCFFLNLPSLANRPAITALSTIMLEEEAAETKVASAVSPSQLAQ